VSEAKLRTSRLKPISHCTPLFARSRRIDASTFRSLNAGLSLISTVKVAALIKGLQSGMSLSAAAPLLLLYTAAAVGCGLQGLVSAKRKADVSTTWLQLFTGLMLNTGIPAAALAAVWCMYTIYTY
jgi:hypothetical protein